MESSFLRFGWFVHYLQVGLGRPWRVDLLWFPVRDYGQLWTGITRCWHLQYCLPDGVGSCEQGCASESALVPDGALDSKGVEPSIG